MTRAPNRDAQRSCRRAPVCRRGGSRVGRIGRGRETSAWGQAAAGGELFRQDFDINPLDPHNQPCSQGNPPSTPRSEPPRMNRLRSAVVVCLGIAAPAPADNSPHSRGPETDGVSTEKNMPIEWSDTKNVAWTLPMPGRGSSTPCVWGDKLFLTSAVEGSNDLVGICVSTSGKELWRKTVGKAANQARADEGDAASASPSTDGKHVWFFVGSGDLACLDVDGNEVWKANCQERYG